MKRIIVLIAAVLATTMFVSTAHTQTPPPAPNITIVKVPTVATVDLYDDAEWVITVRNTGKAPSGLITLTDVLQGEGFVDGWTITGATFSSGCAIDEDTNILTCVGVVPSRIYPLGQQFPGIFLDGTAQVKIAGLALKCGAIENVARADHQYQEETTRLRSNVAKVTIRGCETPTPTPTPTLQATSTLVPLTPTPVSTPTISTPVPPTAAHTATPTITPSSVFATATPFRIAPRPPATGTGVETGESDWLGLFFNIAVGALVLISVSVGVYCAIGYGLSRRKV